jgi:hypothetical protein
LTMELIIVKKVNVSPKTSVTGYKTTIHYNQKNRPQHLVLPNFVIKFPVQKKKENFVSTFMSPSLEFNPTHGVNHLAQKFPSVKSIRYAKHW